MYCKSFVRSGDVLNDISKAFDVLTVHGTTDQKFSFISVCIYASISVGWVYFNDSCTASHRLLNK